MSIASGENDTVRDKIFYLENGKRRVAFTENGTVKQIFLVNFIAREGFV